MSYDSYQSARESMVVSQLHPSNIVDEDVLNAYRSVPREAFVPEEKKAVCYGDESLAMPGGRYLLEPLLHALMVENLKLDKTSRVLDIGGLTGYSAAVLSQLAGQVTAVDQDENAIQFARQIFPALGIYNVEAAVGRHNDQGVQNADYGAILINGAVAERPENLFSLLKPGGRLACVLRPSGSVGKVMIFTKATSGVIAAQTLLDANVSYVPGFEPKPVFTF